MNPYMWRHTKPTSVRNKPGYIRSLLQLVCSVTRFLQLTTEINWNFWKTLRWVYTVFCKITTSCILCSGWLHDIRCGNTSKRWLTTILSICMVYQYLMIRYQTLLLLSYPFDIWISAKGQKAIHNTTVTCSHFRRNKLPKCVMYASITITIVQSYTI